MSRAFGPIRALREALRAVLDAFGVWVTRFVYDPLRPLRTPFGEVARPPVQDVPVRLMMLMPYTACS
jgi:hypothetical protein